MLVSTRPAMALPPPVSVTLEPRQISLGETAQLTITSTGSGMDGITLPQVSGLEFRVVGQSRRLEIINGATLSTTSVVLRVTPQTTGIFTIPGLTPQSQPLVLRVSPDNGTGGSSQYGNPYGPARPPLAGGGSAASGLHMTADGSAFVHMNLPKRDVYVGESIPVDIEVGMRAGFVTSLNGLPTLTGNDFTLNNLSRKPERVEKMIDGKAFTVLTWHSVLAPVKPGTFTLSVETPLTIRVRTRPARDSIIDDMLGDPFMQNFFGATVPKDITAASPPAELKVLALPDGRPADFSGAVGSFKIASELSSPTAAVGDPLTLRLHITGTGNFDRVDTPLLEHVENWKTYPPKSKFTQGDAIGYKGEKIFEQPLIAARPGPQTLPDLAFSYFDPNTRRYETAHSTPPPVTISPALAEGTAPPTIAAATGAATADNAAGAAKPPALPGLRPDHAAGGRSAALLPLGLRPPFLVVPPLLAFAFAGGWLGLRLRGHAWLAPGKRTPPLSPTARRLLAQMEIAARAGDAVTFLTTARNALQQSLSAQSQVAPAEFTQEEMQARLGGDGDEIGRLLALADEANYAGDRITTTDFERWMHIVRRRLQAAIAPVAMVLGLCLLSGAGEVAHAAAASYSASELYNLGNAYARAGKPGMAVLNYERAGLLAPGDPDIEANLRFVRDAARIKSAPPTLFERAVTAASPTTLYWSGLLGIVLAGSCLLSGFATTGHRRLRAIGIAAGVALAAFTVCNGVVLWPRLHDAVVLTAAPARVSPVPMGDPAFTLAEAETVSMTAEHEGFVLIQTRTGKTGWMAKADLAPVIPRP